MNKMLAFVLILIAFTSCQDQPAIDQSVQNAMIDSLVGAKVETLSKEMQEDLDNRMSIELKPKADSIVQARRNVQ